MDIETLLAVIPIAFAALLVLFFARITRRMNNQLILLDPRHPVTRRLAAADESDHGAEAAASPSPARHTLTP